MEEKGTDWACCIAPFSVTILLCSCSLFVFLSSKRDCVFPFSSSEVSSEAAFFKFLRLRSLKLPADPDQLRFNSFGAVSPVDTGPIRELTLVFFENIGDTLDGRFRLWEPCGSGVADRLLKLSSLPAFLGCFLVLKLSNELVRAIFALSRAERRPLLVLADFSMLSCFSEVRTLG